MFDTAVRALLVTDVVDSTKLAEELGDVAMADLWARHDRVARDLLAPHRGLEIDKTDGFLLLFESAAEAVAYAIAYHRAVRPLGVAARAGLHVGPVILRANPAPDVARGAKPLEVEGLAKPTAARVSSVAVGGQTLLTREAADALGPTDLRIVSHGHWRMKGVADPVELLEVGDAHAPFAPPPDGAKVYRVVRTDDLWLPAKEVKHHLPAERDPFVGRTADLQELARRFDDGARLVSVLGTGGTGKTRLVTRFAWTWLGNYPGGAWFCDLSEARSVEGIAYAVGTALDVPLEAKDPVGQLGHAIAGRGRCLVVLDNFEQVARHATDTVGRWLDRAEEASFVVTTREVLGLPGETTLALAPLDADDSVTLFVRRAEAAKRGFVLAAADRPHVEALVRLLDGLPLAIELAAARVRVMPPKTLLERMSQRFKLLAVSGGRHTRQATLKGALDWSWDLLTADEQAALAQVSVFEGGFTLDAAEAVLRLDEAWPVDAVQALVDKSLVRQVAEDRFDLLVSVAEYAAEKLDAAGERPAAEARHGEHFAALGDDESPPHAEIDNLVTACRRAVHRGDLDVAVRAGLGAGRILRYRGPSSLGLELVEAVLAAHANEPVAGQLVVLAGHLAHMGGDEVRAEAWQRRAMAIADATGDDALMASALKELAFSRFESRRLDEARAMLEEALARAARAGDPSVIRAVRATYGTLLFRVGDLEGALRLKHEDLASCRAVGDRITEASLLVNLGITYQRLRRFEPARTCLEQGLAAHRAVGNRRGEATALGNLAGLHFSQGRLREAEGTYRQALALAREVGSRPTQVWALVNLGKVLVALGEHDEGHRAGEEALEAARATGDRVMQAEAHGVLGMAHTRAGRYGPAEEQLAAAREIARDLGDTGAEGMWQLHLAQARLAAGDAHGALEACDEALPRVEGRRPWLEPHAHAIRARAELSLDRPDDALASCERGLDTARAHGVSPTQLLSVLARARHRLGERDAAHEALRDAERALGERPDEGARQAVAQARAELDLASEPPAAS